MNWNLYSAIRQCRYELSAIGYPARPAGNASLWDLMLCNGDIFNASMF